MKNINKPAEDSKAAKVFFTSKEKRFLFYPIAELIHDPISLKIEEKGSKSNSWGIRWPAAVTRTVAPQIRVRWQKAQTESNNAALAVSAANPRADSVAIFQPEQNE